MANELTQKKLQDMSPWERWIWLSVEKTTEDSIRSKYETNHKIIKQLASK